MKDLTVALLQTKLHWEDRDANLEMFGEKIAKIKGSTDLIVLPEMFASGFSLQPAPLAETMDGESVRWMKRMAKAKNSAIVGSLIIREEKKYYNRLIWATPDGEVETYDKRHLFRMAGEDAQYTPGSRKLIVNLHGWNICPLVCYDLRFPVWSRNIF